MLFLVLVIEDHYKKENVQTINLGIFQNKLVAETVAKKYMLSKFYQSELCNPRKCIEQSLIKYDYFCKDVHPYIIPQVNSIIGKYIDRKGYILTQKGITYKCLKEICKRYGSIKTIKVIPIQIDNAELTRIKGLV